MKHALKPMFVLKRFFTLYGMVRFYPYMFIFDKVFGGRWSYMLLLVYTQEPK